MTLFQWISFAGILICALIGGYYPLIKREEARSVKGFPAGESFTTGVFLALALLIMLPNGFHLFGKAFPSVNFPLASLISVIVFLTLLSIEQAVENTKKQIKDNKIKETPAIIPIIMTVMIAIPSFLMGTALGISEAYSAVFIFVAVIVHKGSAGFGLALKLVRSTLARPLTFIFYSLFAISTPLGILLGADLHNHLNGEIMIVTKAFILSIASGLFLYMSTLHELKHSALIVHCGEKRGFAIMLVGFIITALVRLVLGLAHAG